ncbi:MAG: hypothetical protein ACOX6T_17470 [Myxococcales bacterium]
MNDQTRPAGRVTRLFKALLTWTLVLGLTAGVLYLLSERNSRTFTLELRGGELWVMRGRMFPVGFIAYEPDDALLAQAYSPLPIANDPIGGLDLTATYSDRDQLDRALFAVVKELVEIRVSAEDPEKLAEAVRLLRRAELLGGVTEEQRRQLRDLQARVAFFEGRARLDEAVIAARAAVEKLKLASDSFNKYSEAAGELHERIAGLADQLARASRLPLAANLARATRDEAKAVPAEAKAPAPADKPAPAAPETPAAPESASPPPPPTEDKEAAAESP